jgi:hypothetical protein
MFSEDQLRSYLAWAIHGRKLQRQRRKPTRKGPPRDQPYLAWIREMACISCGIEGRSEAAHTGTDGGMGQKASDYSCIPLCAGCHTRRADSYHRIAGGRRGFERRYRVNLVHLVARLNAEWRERVASETQQFR